MINIKQQFAPFCEGCPCVEAKVYTHKVYVDNKPVDATIFVTCEYMDVCSHIIEHLHNYPSIRKT